MNAEPSGPFGLHMGLQLQDIDTSPIESAQNMYYLEAVPKPHPKFTTYVGKIAPQHGLSWIKAIGPDISTSGHGYELATEFKMMCERLESAYGKCDLSDVLLPDSLWNEPRDWMQSLISNERILMACWSNEKHSLRDNVLNLSLHANAADTDCGYLALEYEFTNDPLSRAEQEAADDSVL